jgi:hypothetical protein
VIRFGGEADVQAGLCALIVAGLMLLIAHWKYPGGW